MKLHTTLLLSAVLMAAAAPASQAADPPRNPFGNGALPEILKPYDVDGDGKLSEEERQAYMKAVREGLAERPGRPAGERPKNPFDTDGDGKLSDAEKAAAQEAIRAKIEAERTKRFDELDKDDDGFLTAEEFLAIPGLRPELASRILGHLDKDGDGKISKDEFIAALRPPRPPVGGGGGGEPPAPKPLPDWLKSYDSNNDGVLDRSEMEVVMADIRSGKLVPPAGEQLPQPR